MAEGEIEPVRKGSILNIAAAEISDSGTRFSYGDARVGVYETDEGAAAHILIRPQSFSHAEPIVQQLSWVLDHKSLRILPSAPTNLASDSPMAGEREIWVSFPGGSAEDLIQRIRAAAGEVTAKSGQRQGQGDPSEPPPFIEYEPSPGFDPRIAALLRNPSTRITYKGNREKGILQIENLPPGEAQAVQAALANELPGFMHGYGSTITIDNNGGTITATGSAGAIGASFLAMDLNINFQGSSNARLFVKE